jgi:PAS domain S-box-containing protein
MHVPVQSAGSTPVTFSADLPSPSAWLEQLLNTSQEGIAILHANGHFVYANPRLGEILGTPAEHLLNQSLEILFAPECRYRGKLRELLGGLRPDRPPQHCELHLLAASMTIVAHTTLSLIATGQESPGILLQLRDVTAYKMDENAFFEGWEQARAMIESVPLPVCITATEGNRILYANEEFSHWYGLPLSSLLHMKASELYSRPSERLYVLDELRQNQALHNRLLRVTNADGLGRWCYISATQIDFEGQPAAITGFNDITHLKEYEERMRWRNDLMHAVSNSQSQFISKIDYEVLFVHVISNFLSLTQSEYGFVLALDPDRDHHLEVLAVNHLKWGYDTVEAHFQEVSHNPEIFQKLDSLFSFPLITGETLIANNLSDLPQEPGSFELPYPWIRSFMGLPLYSSGQLIGAIGLSNRALAYTEDLAMELNPFLVTCGNIISAYFNDRRRRYVEEDLQATNRMLRLLLQNLQQFVETAGAPIFALDAEGGFTEWNQMAERVTGYPTEKAINGLNLFDLTDPQHHVRIRSNLNAALAGRASEPIETAFRHQDGRDIILLFNATPRRNLDGKITGAWGVGQDITGMSHYRERLEREVAEKTEALEVALRKEKELTEAKGRFFNMASHEFRTPLSSLYMAADTLERYAERMSPEQRTQKASKIKGCARRIEELLQGSLVIGRVESGKIAFAPEACDLPALCHEIIDEVLTTTQHTHRIALDLQVADTFTFFADPQLIHHFLSNLLLNAIKYSPENRDIRLVVATEAKEWVILRVQDQGLGIAPEEHTKIFEPFYRARHDERYLTQGVGLGLTVAQHCVQLHQGWIQLVSQPGQGSTFSVYLPWLPHSGGAECLPSP